MRPRLKEEHMAYKGKHYSKPKFLPYLGQRKVSEITAKDVIWTGRMKCASQTSRKTGKPVSPYLSENDSWTVEFYFQPCDQIIMI